MFYWAYSFFIHHLITFTFSSCIRNSGMDTYSFKALYSPPPFTSFIHLAHSLACRNSDNIDNSHQWKTNANASVKGPIAINIHWLHISLTHTMTSSFFFWFLYVLCYELITHCNICIVRLQIHIKCVRAYILNLARIFRQSLLQSNRQCMQYVVESLGYGKIIPSLKYRRWALNKEIIDSLWKHLTKNLDHCRNPNRKNVSLFACLFVCFSKLFSNRIDVLSILTRFMSLFHFNFPANIASFAPSKFTNSLKSNNRWQKKKKR